MICTRCWRRISAVPRSMIENGAFKPLHRSKALLFVTGLCSSPVSLTVHYSPFARKGTPCCAAQASVAPTGCCPADSPARNTAPAGGKTTRSSLPNRRAPPALCARCEHAGPSASPLQLLEAPVCLPQEQQAQHRHAELLTCQLRSLPEKVRRISTGRLPVS